MSIGRQRLRLVRQGFPYSGKILHFSYKASVIQSFEQAVALLDQPVPISSRPYAGRRIREYRQCGSLAPRKLRGRPSEISPCRSFKSHDIASERGVGFIQLKYPVFGISEFEPCGQHRFRDFLPQSPFLAARKPYHLHGNRAASADDMS